LSANDRGAMEGETADRLNLLGLSPTELQAEVGRLVGWVRWLQRQDVDVPTCWVVHGFVVRLLQALRLYHLSVASPFEAIAWWRSVLECMARPEVDRLRRHDADHGWTDLELDRGQVSEADVLVKFLTAQQAVEESR